MSQNDAKRSVARLRRLAPMLDNELDNAAAAIEILVAEAEIGEFHPELWERLNAAAARDHKETELGAAYEAVARGRRLKPLAPATQAEVLMHGADFLQGILGNGEGAAALLTQVVAVVPDHTEAFERLQRFLTEASRNSELVQLYVTVAAACAEVPVLLIGRALGLIDLLPRSESLPLETCERLVRLAGTNPRVIAVLDAHCSDRGRFSDAAALIELAIQTGALPEKDVLQLRRRLVSLYLGNAKAPEAAIPHVEELLRADSTNEEARAAADKLLTVPSVAARAAAALIAARKGAP
jgi:predicted protein tyrosine phosphatase